MPLKKARGAANKVRKAVKKTAKKAVNNAGYLKDRAVMSAHTANVNRKTDKYRKAVAPAKKDIAKARDKSKSTPSRVYAAANAKVRMNSNTYSRNKMAKAGKRSAAAAKKIKNKPRYK